MEKGDLKKNECPWNEWATSVAAKNCIKYSPNNGCQSNEYAIDIRK